MYSRIPRILPFVTEQVSRITVRVPDSRMRNGNCHQSADLCHCQLNTDEVTRDGQEELDSRKISHSETKRAEILSKFFLMALQLLFSISTLSLRFSGGIQTFL